MGRLLQEKTQAANNQRRTSATIIGKTLEAIETLPGKTNFKDTTTEEKKEKNATKEAPQQEAKKEEAAA